MHTPVRIRNSEVDGEGGSEGMPLPAASKKESDENETQATCLSGAELRGNTSETSTADFFLIFFHFLFVQLRCKFFIFFVIFFVCLRVLRL
jgi:hypothetical protein